MFSERDDRHKIPPREECAMRAEMGRAGRKKNLRRAAATGVLAALLLGLVAGVVLPARAKSAERAAPADTCGSRTVFPPLA